jgi:predicted DNA-binding protein
MRIAIDIPDELHARLKAIAKEEGTTLRAIVLRGIEAVLNKRRSKLSSPSEDDIFSAKTQA